MKKPTLIPRGMQAPEAAAFLGLSEDDFHRYCSMGKIPFPAVIGDIKLWDRHSLEVAGAFTYKRPAIIGIYVIGFDQYIKIGWSRDVTVRISALQDGVPTDLRIHKIFAGKTRRDEGELLSRFAEYRTRGEWFRFEGQLRAWIEGGCE